MKRVIYGILIAGAMAIPTRPLELGKLKPVEVVRIDKRGEQILIETDLGDSGSGKTVAEAILDLKERTPGTVYLDTAEYALIPKDETILTQIAPYLQEKVRICHWEGEMEIERVAEYLDVHRPNVKLKDYQTGSLLQTLEWKKDSFYLCEKST